MSFDSYQLKYIALLSMIIDHSAVVFRYMLPARVYLAMRCLGRFSFPIFCFVLVEGFFHSSNRNRYLTRLLLFALLSEIPYDLALMGSFWNLLGHPSAMTVMDWSGQNVFLTLALAFAAMMVMENYQNDTAGVLVILILFSLAGEILRCDYGCTGIITIFLFYQIRKHKGLPLLCAYLPLMLMGIHSHVQLFCILSLPFLQGYNGEKGRGSRYFFYIVYPAHLLLLLLIRYGYQSLT